MLDKAYAIRLGARSTASEDTLSVREVTERIRARLIEAFHPLF